MKADGTPVAATLSIGSNNTVVTLDQTTSLGAGSNIAVATINVKSITGVSLAANYVVNFTVPESNNLLTKLFFKSINISREILNKKSGQ